MTTINMNYLKKNGQRNLLRNFQEETKDFTQAPEATEQQLLKLYHANLKPEKMNEEDLKDLKNYLSKYLGICKNESEYTFILTMMNYIENRKSLFPQDIVVAKAALQRVYDEFKACYDIIVADKGKYKTELEDLYKMHLLKINHLLQIL